MKAKLQARLKSKKGFTLVELLVVVAIIAILVAISIPMVTTSLNSAKQATDDANVRAAEGAAMVEYLTEEPSIMGTDAIYFYNAETGMAVKASDETVPPELKGKGYNQQKYTDGSLMVNNAGIAVESGVIMVKINGSTTDTGITSVWKNASGT